MPRKKKEKLITVDENTSLSRDITTDAIINTNSDAYNARLKRIEKSKLDSQQTEKINKLESDVEEIKNLLKQLASK